MAVLRPSEYSPNNMAASSLDERVAEGVRRFPVLYDKSCKDFKDANKKKNAREEVAKQAGLSSNFDVDKYYEPKIAFFSAEYYFYGVSVCAK